MSLAGDQPIFQHQNGCSSRDPWDPRPRDGFLSWDDYFMAVAFLSAQRSKDPAKQVLSPVLGTPMRSMVPWLCRLAQSHLRLHACEGRAYQRQPGRAMRG